MQCDYYDAGVCRSCTLIEQPYAAQVADKQRHVADLLAGHPDLVWLEPVTSREEGFRNKAKMVVTGSVEAPTLGILDAEGAGVDLRHCGLHTAGIRAALPVLARFVTRAGLTPYDITARRGELKHVLVTESPGTAGTAGTAGAAGTPGAAGPPGTHESPDSMLMVRFVLRTDEAVPRLRKHLAWLLAELPAVRVVSANVQPEPKAVLEGEREIVLTDAEALPMHVAGMELMLRPQSFFQTNTEVAAALYEQARSWVDEIAPRTMWDLYCGVGGFALACAAPGRDVLGVEVSVEAVASARATAAPAGAGVRFEVGDATTITGPAPELVVVNPPRRGIGDLAAWLDASDVQHVVYSSCNAESLARDLESMPSLRPRRARLLDMFPQSRHYEVLVLLERVDAGPPRS